MRIIGLTGSIGMGKSTAAARLKARGIPVFDADAAVHDLYRGPLAQKIDAVFPGTLRDGAVDRAALGRALVAAPNRFVELERLVHPAVRDAERAFLVAAHDAGNAVAVLEIPLLFESGADRMVDVVIVVSAGSEAQFQRVIKRPGMTAEKLKALLERQMPDAEKRKRADFVVDTSGSIEASGQQIEDILATVETWPEAAFDTHWR